MNLSALLEKPITKITEDLDELTIAQLLELRALETTPEAKNRSSLLSLIANKIDELKGTEPNASAESAKPATEAPAWQAPDYAGVLTGAQALWRHANAPQFARKAITK